MVPPSSHHGRDIAALRQITIFRSLDDCALAAVAAIARRQAHREGAALAGPSGAYVFAVAYGGVRLYQSSPAAAEVTLDIFGPGDAFMLGEAGEHGEPRGRAMVLDGGAVVYQLPREGLFRLLRAYPAALEDIIADLCGRLAGSYDHTAEIALYKAPVRLARDLLRRAGAGGRIVATRTALATWSAINYTDVVRWLRSFHDKGWIASRSHSQEIVVLRPDALADK